MTIMNGWAREDSGFAWGITASQVRIYPTVEAEKKEKQMSRILLQSHIVPILIIGR